MGSSGAVWGHLVYDPVRKGDADQVVKFCICVARNGKGTDYFDVTISSGKHADAVFENLKKGMFAVVTGDLQTEYVDGTGKKRKNAEYTNARVAWDAGGVKAHELVLASARSINQICADCKPKGCENCLLYDLSRKHESYKRKEGK